ncbi:hypothetical protein [Neisseria sp.]|uniref:hypothetical protein n=1 Tax=Neisseria sp. TaxID=192066 RepID=UPI0035A0FF2B
MHHLQADGNTVSETPFRRFTANKKTTAFTAADSRRSETNLPMPAIMLFYRHIKNQTNSIKNIRLQKILLNTPPVFHIFLKSTREKLAKRIYLVYIRIQMNTKRFKRNEHRHTNSRQRADYTRRC